MALPTKHHTLRPAEPNSGPQTWSAQGQSGTAPRSGPDSRTSPPGRMAAPRARRLPAPHAGHGRAPALRTAGPSQRRQAARGARREGPAATGEPPHGAQRAGCVPPHLQLALGRTRRRPSPPRRASGEVGGKRARSAGRGRRVRLPPPAEGRKERKKRTAGSRLTSATPPEEPRRHRPPRATLTAPGVPRAPTHRAAWRSAASAAGGGASHSEPEATVLTVIKSAGSWLMLTASSWRSPALLSWCGVMQRRWEALPRGTISGLYCINSDSAQYSVLHKFSQPSVPSVVGRHWVQPQTLYFQLKQCVDPYFFLQDNTNAPEI